MWLPEIGVDEGGREKAALETWASRFELRLNRSQPYISIMGFDARSV
jgi:hypothetical protein